MMLEILAFVFDRGAGRVHLTLCHAGGQLEKNMRVFILCLFSARNARAIFLQSTVFGKDAVRHARALSLSQSSWEEMMS